MPFLSEYLLNIRKHLHIIHIWMKVYLLTKFISLLLTKFSIKKSIIKSIIKDMFRIPAWRFNPGPMEQGSSNPYLTQSYTGSFFPRIFYFRSYFLFHYCWLVMLRYFCTILSESWVVPKGRTQRKLQFLLLHNECLVFNFKCWRIKFGFLAISFLFLIWWTLWNKRDLYHMNLMLL